MRYIVQVQRGDSPSEFAFGATVPDLPGCFSTGNTLEELEANLREAVQGWIEVAREDGQQVAEPSGFLFQIEVPA